MGSSQMRLTIRDHAILKDLLDWSVLSLEQIRRRHFAKLTISVSSERITKLHLAGLVSKQRVGILIHHGSPKEIGTVVTLTRAGQAALVHFGGRSLQSPRNPSPLNTAELHHELLLVELAEALKAQHPECKVEKGMRCKNGSAPFERVPDLVMGVGDERWGVELELTAKSATRYRQILASYQVESRYDRILYVVGNSTIAVKIRHLLGDQMATVAVPFGSFDRFTFTPLQEYFCGPDDTNKLEQNTKTKNFGEKLNEK